MKESSPIVCYHTNLFTETIKYFITNYRICKIYALANILFVFPNIYTAVISTTLVGTVRRHWIRFAFIVKY